MSLWSKHVDKWKDCKACRLHQCRKKIVLGRGKLPCDVMYVGEAPGLSEDALGVPFIGPAGKLLDQQIQLAEEESGKVNVRKFWTNIVACIPKLPNTNRKAEEPLPEEINACHERMEEIMHIAKPKVLVAVGKLAGKEARVNDWCKYAKIVEVAHPAWIMRITNPSQKQHEFDRVIIQLTNVFSEWL